MALKTRQRVSAREYARQRGISNVAVSKALKRGRIPSHHGLIDPREADAALEKHHPTLAEAIRRKTEAQAQREELKLLKEQAEVVPIRLVREKQEQINSIIRARLLAIPSKMAPIVFGMTTPAQIKGKLESEIYEVLGELAGHATDGTRMSGS